MLKGYTVPLSPLGKANLVAAPPWHYSGDVIALEFWTEPAAANASLPPGLSPDPKSAGHVLGLFVDWQFTAQDDEYLDPARYQYREFYLLVDAVYKNQPVAWTPYMFVDNDSAMARGHAQGYPKRLCSVFQTRSFAAPSAAAAPIANGTKLGASLCVHGQRLAEGKILEDFTASARKG
jgi:acetoacetate decarboxylase